MLAKREIQSSLKALDRKYRSATADREAQFAAKLAIIEACGWIEERIDDIVNRAVRRSVITRDGLDAVNEQIRKTSGFTYDAHIRKLLLLVVGWTGVERLEGGWGSVERDRLKAALLQLRDVRNSNAHTFIRGTTPRLNAPSWTIAQFEAARLGLAALARVMDKEGL